MSFFNPTVNPYRMHRGCPECWIGEHVIYNIGYPPDYEEHSIRLCERHYRKAEAAARRFDLSMSVA
jgi:hypothetical protein